MSADYASYVDGLLLEIKARKPPQWKWKEQVTRQLAAAI
jgi:hypothetical protein